MTWPWISSEFSTHRSKLMWWWLWPQQLSDTSVSISNTKSLEEKAGKQLSCKSTSTLCKNAAASPTSYQTSTFTWKELFHPEAEPCTRPLTQTGTPYVSGHELLHHLRAQLMQCIPGTAQEVLSKLQIRLSHTRCSCLPAAPLASSWLSNERNRGDTLWQTTEGKWKREQDFSTVSLDEYTDKGFLTADKGFLKASCSWVYSSQALIEI